jgi:uncharacterized protein (DUF2461 family)
MRPRGDAGLSMMCVIEGTLFGAARRRFEHFTLARRLPWPLAVNTEVRIMFEKKKRAGSLALALGLTGCFASVGQQQPLSERDQTQMASGCQQQIDKMRSTYCDEPMESVPVGMSEQLTRQRNGLAMSCKDDGSAAKLAELDTCLAELKSRE